MKAFFARSLIIVTPLLLAACASTPTALVNSDPAADFSQYRTFGYFPQLSTDKAQYESLVSTFLKVAVAQEFDMRGFTHDEEDPQLRVNFYINTKEKIKTRSVPSAGGYYGYRDPFYDPWGGYGVGVSYQTRVDQYTEGTLHIDVVDAATKKLVWEGAIAGKLTKKDISDMEKTVDQAVASVMKGFPIQPGGAP